MISTKLKGLLQPMNHLAVKAPLAPRYSAIELQDDGLITACAPWGLLTVITDIALPRTVYIDAKRYLGALAGWPSDTELCFGVSDNRLTWTTDYARGWMATMGNVDDMKDLSEAEFTYTFGALTSKQMAEAFTLGALGCRPGNPLNDGYGAVEVECCDGQLHVCGSDNDVLTSYWSPWGESAAEGFHCNISLRGAQLLGAVIRDGGELAFATDQKGDNRGLYYRDDVIGCCFANSRLRNQKPVSEMAARFATALTVADIPKIAEGVRRAAVLAESPAYAEVLLSVHDSQLKLAFGETKAGIEQFYFVEDLADFPDLPPARLRARDVIEALRHCDQVVLDYMDQPQVVFRTSNDAFRYIVSGRMNRD